MTAATVGVAGKPREDAAAARGGSVAVQATVPAAAFDTGLRRWSREFPDRDFFECDGIGPSPLGRIGLGGDPGFVRQCLARGVDVQPDTADVALREGPGARFTPEIAPCRDP